MLSRDLLPSLPILVLLSSDSEASQGQAQVSGDWGWVVSPAPALFPEASWMPRTLCMFLNSAQAENLAAHSIGLWNSGLRWVSL